MLEELFLRGLRAAAPRCWRGQAAEEEAGLEHALYTEELCGHVLTTEAEAVAGADRRQISSFAWSLPGHSKETCL